MALNALNFQPLNQGIDALGQGFADYHQQEINDQNQALRQQAAKREQTTFDQDQQKQLAIQTGNLFESHIAPEQDPQKRAAMVSAFVNSHPSVRSSLAQHNIDPNDTEGVINGVMADYQQYKDPGAEQMEKLKIAKGQQDLKIGEQTLASGKYLPVAPGTDLFNAKSGQFVQNQGGSNIVGTIADGIQAGRQPPVFTGMGMGKLVGPIRAELERRGVDVAQMQNEWNRGQAQIRSLNGPQMTRYVGLAQSVDKTIDRANELADQMEQSSIPLLNKAELIKLTQTQGNSPAGQLATQYLTAVNTLKEEFAGLAQGGYAPTEPAWELANQQVNANYGVKQLHASLGEIQRLMRYRLNGIPGINAVGPGAANRYIPGEEQPMGAAHGATPAPPTATPSAPAQAGWGYVGPVQPQAR